MQAIAAGVDNAVMVRRVAGCLVAASLVLAVTHVAVAAQGPANPQAVALKDFADRVKAYMALHEKVASRLPPAGNGGPAAVMAERRDALAAAIRSARKDAHEGDLFTPEVGAQVRAIVRRDLEARDLRDTIAAVEEVPIQHVWVNMSWPPNAPRATIPPRILTSLYPLPKDLEYRLLDRHLVLVDLDADLVADLVRNVLPSTVRPRH